MRTATCYSVFVKTYEPGPGVFFEPWPISGREPELNVNVGADLYVDEGCLEEYVSVSP